MAIRLHELYPIPNGTPVELRPNEIAALRADVGVAANEDVIFDICFMCSEATLVSRTAGTGSTIGRFSTVLGPLCQALLAQMGAPPAPTSELIRHAILGNRYIATSVR